MRPSLPIQPEYKLLTRQKLRRFSEVEMRMRLRTTVLKVGETFRKKQQNNLRGKMLMQQCFCLGFVRSSEKYR